ncbi:MAG TPA: hypothetical protein VK919_14655 [Solirubrobacterales bacterium]|nr:hypothetical protein [Solirubrobacterales bacterium]
MGADARGAMTPALVIATALPGAGGGAASAAALAVAAASLDRFRGRGGVLVVELGGDRRRGPTMLASAPARRLEDALRAEDLAAAARGAICWAHCTGVRGEALSGLRIALRAARDVAAAAVALLPPDLWRPVLEDERLRVRGGLLRAELPAQRSLAALAVRELVAAGLRAKVAATAPGTVAGRRALAGLDPGGAAGERARRLARGLFGPRPAGPVTPLPGAAAAVANG